MSASKLKQVALELQQGGSGLLTIDEFHERSDEREFGPVDPLGQVEHVKF